MKKLIILLLSVLLITFTISDCYNVTYQVCSQTSITAPADDVITCDVVNVIDGDTIVINVDGKNTKIRMIGIDTPESVHSDESKNCEFGKTASDYTKNLLTNKRISLEYDTDKYDQYGRVLAYVYLGETMVNYDLVFNGYAVAKKYEPNTKYADTFTQAQIEAEKSKVGMWSDDVNNSDCNLKNEYYIYY